MTTPFATEMLMDQHVLMTTGHLMTLLTWLFCLEACSQLLSLLRVMTAALPGLCGLEQASLPLSKFQENHNKYPTEFLRREHEITCEKGVFKRIRAPKCFFKNSLFYRSLYSLFSEAMIWNSTCLTELL